MSGEDSKLLGPLQYGVFSYLPASQRRRQGSFKDFHLFQTRVVSPGVDIEMHRSETGDPA